MLLNEEGNTAALKDESATEKTSKKTPSKNFSIFRDNEIIISDYVSLFESKQDL